ncbi:family 43 glycosylhydrolase [Plebeiibacterium marinum]|uniref:Family 43 glycosylhydrolase n=1 Tax=Plebeiibacterium marinum TaxID=2992111 RepID=A0AAE3MCG0_9BACT|nr:family 43 glycosylhydrolase [Plebeiobacterium marinum]MCW3805383.1 family 43 glycosylhydrolase [Plebeiobacterium marinum]
MKRVLYIAWIILVIFGCTEGKQEIAVQTNSNPLLPGYFADPTIKKFGDTYYIYSTTDGVKLASGQPTVWLSKDLDNWFNYELDIDLPEGLTNCWAPDVVKGQDGRYYYYMGNCQFGCNIYGYVSDNPIGPWKALNEGKPVVPVGTGTENLPALDAQFLSCSDGSLYTYFGTWCHVFKGLGWAKIDPSDMHTILDEGYIPNEQLPELFEAVYPIERNGKYILMYSAGDCRLSSYAVHYAYADSPTGPYKYGQNNPILKTNEDMTVDSPGHHSLIEIDGKTYILYHRHDNPHSSGGEFRQVCMDEMVFANDTTILKIVPTHTGVKRFKTKLKNIALGAGTEASSEYHLKSKASVFTQKPVDYIYSSQNATDDDNGTLWKAENCSMPQSIIIDLGTKQSFKRILTQFEYSTFYYQYKIETSNDKNSWELYADKTKNETAGSPMIDDKEVAARYIKVTVTGTEKSGMLAAIWNVKVYNTLFDIPEYNNQPVKVNDYKQPSNALEVLFDAKDLPAGTVNNSIVNEGDLQGEFIPVGNPKVKKIGKHKALYLDGKSYLELSKNAPDNFNWNAPFTVAAWIYPTEETIGQCILSWNSRDNMLQGSYASVMYGKGNFGAVAHGDGSVDMPFVTVPPLKEWTQIAVTFDGMKECIYVNGELDNEMPLNLFVEADKVKIGSSGFDPENFKGFIREARLYNKAMNKSEIENLYKEGSVQ